MFYYIGAGLLNARLKGALDIYEGSASFKFYNFFNAFCVLILIWTVNNMLQIEIQVIPWLLIYNKYFWTSHTDA